MLDVDQNDAEEDDRREDQAAAWNFATEERNDDGGSKDGRLPSGGDDPTCSVLRTEGDERIENAKADGARNDPEQPMFQENIDHIAQSFFAVFHQQDDDQKDEHETEAQRRRPHPVTALQTQGAVDDEGAAEK